MLHSSQWIGNANAQQWLTPNAENHIFAGENRVCRK